MSDDCEHRVIRSVGAARYRTACIAAQQVALHFGDAGFDHAFDPVLDADLPHEIGDLVMSLQLPGERKMAIFLDIFQDLPDYGLLMVINLNWFDLGHAAHDLFWEAARHILSRPNEPRVKPLEYSLAVDFFEDARTFEAAWEALVQYDASPLLLSRVLANAGPVPAVLREPVYERLMGDPSWHGTIVRSLLASRGQYREPEEKRRAALILHRLRLPPQTPQLSELRAFLEEESS